MNQQKSLILSGPMIRATLSGQKTVTRRIVKEECLPVIPRKTPFWLTRLGDGLHITTGDTTADERIPFDIGNRLWVRETWRNKDGMERPGDPAVYRADWPDAAVRWTSPRFMKRSLSRFTVVLQEIRVERLKDMTEEDALAEGMGDPSVQDYGGPCAKAHASKRELFARVWHKLHGQKSWKENPIVFVLTYTMLKGNIDQAAHT